jgi:16S rRNA (guanine(966)-N(2))-methyltransferase RsmD
MRVITGVYKGRTIRTVDDLSVRPATDRVRQAIFNMLETRIRLDGSAVLDLFAGSGSLGIEALSRGARQAVFVEGGKEAARILQENLTALGCEDSAELLAEDALEYLRTTGDRYDLIFADPPYVYPATGEIPALIFERGVLSPGGFLLIEHSRDLQFASGALYSVGPVKRFGRTFVTFFQGTHT